MVARPPDLPKEQVEAPFPVPPAGNILVSRFPLHDQLKAWQGSSSNRQRVYFRVENAQGKL
jgi:hypothetical protein